MSSKTISPKTFNTNSYLQETKLSLQASNSDSYVLVLCKVGDFYESYGVDSLLLTTLFSFQSMGGKLRSGFPLANLQVTIDRILLDIDVTVAVVEEVGDDGNMKRREVKGILRRGQSEYLHNLHMRRTHAVSSRKYDTEKVVRIESTVLGETLTVVDVERGGWKVYRNLNERAAENVLRRVNVGGGRIYHEGEVRL